MEHKILYHCTGTCGGVSPVAKNCGAESCNRYNQPLKAYKQCDGCAAATDRDGTNHFCDKCQPVE